MAQIQGSEGSITFASGAAGELRGFSIEMNAETYQTKFPTINTPNPALEYAAGSTSWSGSADIYFDTADAGFGFAQLDDGSNNWEGVSGSLVAVVDDNTTDGQVSGTVIITSVSISSTHDGVVEATVSFQGSGELALQVAAA